HNVADELRALVDRLAGPQQGSWSLFVEAFGPGSDGRGRDVKDVGRLGQRPAAGGAQLQDGQTLSRLVVRPLVRRDPAHACVLEADLLAVQSNVQVALVGLGSMAADRPSAFASVMRQGYDMEQSGLNRACPTFGKCQPRTKP